MCERDHGEGYRSGQRQPPGRLWLGDGNAVRGQAGLSRVRRLKDNAGPIARTGSRFEHQWYEPRHFVLTDGTRFPLAVRRIL